MGKMKFYRIMVAATALALTGCGLADSRSPVPGFMRAQDAEPAPLETPPDVKQMVGDHLDTVFTTASAPHNVRISPVHHDLRGPGWVVCVQAELNSAMGKPLGPQTYLVTISGGEILDRRRTDASDTCLAEHFEPI
jgi:hypothetical protein